MTKRCLYIISDLHCGSQLGMMLSGTKLFDPELGEFEPQQTEFQKYTEKIYLESIEKFRQFSKDIPSVVMILGDLNQGNKFPSMFVSDRLTDQPFIAVKVLDPLYKLSNLTNVKICAGTSAHNFGNAAGEITIMEFMRERYPNIPTDITYHGLLNCADVLIDYAHHAPTTGLRSWLKGNYARFYLRDIMFREILRGRTPPRLVLRGHVHADVHEFLEVANHIADLFVIPSMAGMEDYSQQSTKHAENLTNGALFLELTNGMITRCHRDYHLLDLRTVEKI